MSTISERLRQIREARTSGRQEFSDLTGIAKGTVTGYEQTGRSPRAEVLEAVAKQWPEYAYWLITGMTDPANGHISPELDQKREDSSGAGTAG